MNEHNSKAKQKQKEQAIINGTNIISSPGRGKQIKLDELTEYLTEYPGYQIEVRSGGHLPPVCV